MKTSDTYGVHITMAVSPRYQRLAKEVLSRLPSRWNAGRVVRLEESKEMLYLRNGQSVAACAIRLRFKVDEMHVLTLYTSALHTLSDQAVRWVLAREFGRMASDVRPSLFNRWSGKPIQEDSAEAQALTWGFSEERQQFEREYVLPKAS